MVMPQMQGPFREGGDLLAGLFGGQPGFPSPPGSAPPAWRAAVLGQGPEDLLAQMMGQHSPTDQPTRARPSEQILRDRKSRTLKFWEPRNRRMLEDERVYKLLEDVEERLGDENIGQSETLTLNDPYVTVEKISNMVAAQEPIIESPLRDPSMKLVGQKVKDFLYWWRETANLAWLDGINNTLSRDEVYYLALRGWLTGRIMLDPADQAFPYRYDLIDPINVYPTKGGKGGVRWVWHVYRDTKANILGDLGWSQDILDRVEETLKNLDSEAQVEVASYYDDVWHVMFLDDVEIWSANHEYGFIPWVIAISWGPPIRRSDPVSGSGSVPSRRGARKSGEDFTEWWGVSVFTGIRDVYKKLNKLASAILTEAMKAPNPPVIMETTPGGMLEGKAIDTAAGATNTILYNQERVSVLQYGFKPAELAPLMQLLTSARDRGALPGVMYGEGANFLSGFAVNLLTSGARDILFPLIKAHEFYLMRLFRRVLQMTAEIYPYPISMVETDKGTGDRSIITSITPDEIRTVGYGCQVYYREVTPQDKQMLAMIASNLVREKLISLDTARGKDYLGLRNPALENKKIISEQVYQDPSVMQAAIPLALIQTDPTLYYIWSLIEMQKQQMMQMQQQMMMLGAPPPPGGPPGAPPGIPPEMMPPAMAQGGPPPAPGNAGMIG